MLDMAVQIFVSSKNQPVKPASLILGPKNNHEMHVHQETQGGRSILKLKSNQAYQQCPSRLRVLGVTDNAIK